MEVQLVHKRPEGEVSQATPECAAGSSQAHWHRFGFGAACALLLLPHILFVNFFLNLILFFDTHFWYFLKDENIRSYFR